MTTGQKRTPLRVKSLWSNLPWSQQQRNPGSQKSLTTRMPPSLHDDQVWMSVFIRIWSGSGHYHINQENWTIQHRLKTVRSRKQSSPDPRLQHISAPMFRRIRLNPAHVPETTLRLFSVGIDSQSIFFALKSPSRIKDGDNRWLRSAWVIITSAGKIYMDSRGLYWRLEIKCHGVDTVLNQNSHTTVGLVTTEVVITLGYKAIKI
jgi:hypothetical protein